MGDKKFTYNANGSKWGAVGEPVPLRILLERVSIDDPEFKENGFESPEDPQHNTDQLSVIRRGHSIIDMFQRNNRTYNVINGINGTSGTSGTREATSSSGVPSVVYMPQRFSIQQSLAASEAFCEASTWTYETRGTREALASQPQRFPILQSGAAREALREASVGTTNTWGTRGTRQGTASPAAGVFSLPQLYPIRQSAENTVLNEVNVGTINTWGTRGTRQGTASPAAGAFSLPQEYPILQSAENTVLNDVNVTSSGIRGIRGNTGTREAAIPLHQSSLPRKVPLEPNDPRRYINDQPGVKLELSLREVSSASKECSFCKQNGEQPFFFQGHNLTDSLGECACPVLLNLTCPLCEHTGKSASHTYTHCPNVRRQRSLYQKWVNQPKKGQL